MQKGKAMQEAIKALIEELRNNSQIYQFDEATTKQAIILRLLNILGWNVFDINEVKPEYSMTGKRVDYALLINGQVKAFIEVKKISQDLEGHQEQLLNYSFKIGVKLSILTNGLAWWFYLPLKEGSWDQRKFYAIDLIQQDIEDITQKFIDFLSRENIQSGHAILTAEKIYKGRIREIEIRRNMPRAWNKLVSEPDELLVELLGETLEKLSGFKPDNEYIKEFLKKNLNRILISSSPPKPTPPSPPIQPPLGGPPKPRNDFPPDGTLCKFEYKGQLYEGIIKDRKLHVKGIGVFSSLSSASGAVTNTSRNGWRDWKLKLPNATDWILADTWRKRKKFV